MGDNDEDHHVPPVKFRADEEQEIFTEMAFRECQRWIQAVTRQELSHLDNFRKSLENGVILCQLLNTLRPGSVKRINKLNTPIAGLDNLSVFLKTCEQTFGLPPDQLFDATDLEDLSNRAIAEKNADYIKQETDRRLTNVVITVYWLAQSIEDDYYGPKLDYNSFSGLIQRKDCPSSRSSYGRSDSTYGIMNQHSRQSSSNRSNDSTTNRHSAAFSDSTDDFLHSSSDVSHDSLPHTRSSSGDSTELYPNTRSDYSRLMPEKRKGAAGDPMQFVTHDRKMSLAETAKDQMDMLAHLNQSKNPQKSSFSMDEDEEDVVWKSNLSNWRNVRRRKSAASIAQKEILEATYADEEKEVRPTKTFNQMVEERERRVSSYNAYPIGDEDDIFAVPTAPMSRSKSLHHESDAFPKPMIKSTLRHAHNYIESVLSEKQEHEEQNDSRNRNKNRENERTDNVDNEDVTSHSMKSKSDNKSTHTDNNTLENDIKTTTKPRRKHTYPVDEDDQENWIKPVTKTEIKHEPTSNHVTSHKVSTSKNEPVSNNHVGYKVSAVKDDFDVTRRSPTKTEDRSALRRKSEFSLFERKFGAKEVVDDKPKGKLSSVNEVTKSGKVGNILKKLENETDKKVDKKSDVSRSTFAKSRNFYQSMPESNDLHSRSSKSLDSNDKTRKWNADSSDKTKKWNADNDDKSRKWNTDSSDKTKKWNVDGNDRTHKWNVDSKTKDSSATELPRKSYVDKLITIRHGPKRESGFGFTFSGGKDLHEPIMVNHVDMGGSADICELNVSDEVTAIDQVVCCDLSHDDVQDIVTKAGHRGLITLKIRRYFNRGARLSRYNEVAESKPKDGVHNDTTHKTHENFAKEKSVERSKNSDSTPMIDKLLHGYNKNEILPLDNTHDGLLVGYANNKNTKDDDLSNYTQFEQSHKPNKLEKSEHLLDLDIMMSPNPEVDTSSLLSPTSINSPSPVDTENLTETITEERQTLHKLSKTHESQNPVDEITETRQVLYKPSRPFHEENTVDRISEERQTFQKHPKYHAEVTINNNAVDDKNWRTENNNNAEVNFNQSNSTTGHADRYGSPYAEPYTQAQDKQTKTKHVYKPLRAHEPSSSQSSEGPPESLFRWQSSLPRSSKGNVHVSEMGEDDVRNMYDQYGIKPSHTSAADDMKTMDGWLNEVQKQNELNPERESPNYSTSIDLQLPSNHTQLYIDPANQPKNTSQSLPAYSFNVNLSKQSGTNYEDELTEKERLLQDQENEIRRQQEKLQQEREELLRERELMRSGRSAEPTALKMTVHEPSSSKSRQSITYSTIVEPNTHNTNTQSHHPNTQETHHTNAQFQQQTHHTNAQHKYPQDDLLLMKRSQQPDLMSQSFPSNTQSYTLPANTDRNDLRRGSFPSYQQMPKQHWMLQEAEQRLFESDADAGPIKLPPNVMNRWNDNSLPQNVRDQAYESELDRSRQFLTQKLSAVNRHSPKSLSPNRQTSPYQNPSPSSISPPNRQQSPSYSHSPSPHHQSPAPHQHSPHQQSPAPHHHSTSHQHSPTPHHHSPVPHQHSSSPHQHSSPHQRSLSPPHRHSPIQHRQSPTQHQPHPSTRTTKSMSPSTRETDPTASISGKAKCSGCGDELGETASQL